MRIHLPSRAYASYAVLSSFWLAACGGDHQLDCKDLYPEGEMVYSDIAPLFIESGPRGCSDCHNTETPINGYNFEGPGVTYEALSRKMEIIYPQIASGRMPRDGEPWNDIELRMLRSWYCDGAFYEELPP